MKYFLHKYKKIYNIFICIYYKFNYKLFFYLFNLFKQNLYLSYLNINKNKNFFFGYSKKKIENLNLKKNLFNRVVYYSGFNYKKSKKNIIFNIEYFFYINKKNIFSIVINNIKISNLKKKIIILKKLNNLINKYSEKIINYNFFYKNSEDFSINKNKYKNIYLFIKKKINIGKIMQLQIGKEKIFKSNIFKSNIFFYLNKKNLNVNKIYLNLIKKNIICFTPEVLMERNNKKIFMFPIAGSINRGKNIILDLIKEYKLKKDKKEISEHLMLIDLTRNDLNKISGGYKTNVTKSFYIKKFKSIQHIISNVKTHIKKKKIERLFIDSLSPSGTLSGTPKKKSIDYISKLERKRESYGGSLGHIYGNKIFKIFIIIRSLINIKKYLFLRSASGIVLNSILSNEWKELNNKLKIFLLKK
ncbi:chorismate-binding protein [Candidatus Vidania fulgoroideorum]